MPAGFLRSVVKSLSPHPRARKNRAPGRSLVPLRAEQFETRALLSAVSFNGGTLEFEADAGEADLVTVSAPDADTLRIDVGNGDAIVLDAAIAADPAFTLSNGDATLEINVGAGGVVVTEADFLLGDDNDTLTFDSFTSGVDISADGGSGNDTISAAALSQSVVLVGGTGEDLLTGGDGNDALIGGSGDDELRGGGGNDNLIGGGQIEVTVTNLQTTDGALLTPFVLATQNDTYDFFNVGSAASGTLERLAEDGTTGPRIAAALGSGGVNEAVATPGGPLAPGESRTISLRADSLNNLTQFLSFASMVIPSNDAFIGNDNPQEIPLFDAAGELIERVGAGAYFITGDDVYDAGTEVNDEIPANTAALAQAAPNTGVTENGVIAQHPGFQGSVRLGGPVGNILTARPNADFTDGNPNIASIEITSNDGNDILIGGSGNDTIVGGDGNDTLIGGFGDDDLQGGDGDDTLVGGGQIEITVTNLQTADGALLTPFFLATTDGVYDFFDVGSAASASLESLAEDGATGGRITAALNSGGVNEALATPGGPLAPGDSRTVTFYATSTNNLTRYLSFASMVIPSNDAFIGNDSPLEIDLFDAAGNLIQRVGDGAFVITGDDVYDAGTEVNDEIPANTAALAQAAPNTGVTENGVIAQHPGFQGSARLGGPVGNILTARPNADFTDGNPNVASIQVGTTLDGNDTLDGGAGNDTLDGTEGDDTLTGGLGDDTIIGGIGNDRIFGNEGVDNIDGGEGDDTLIGGSGNDTILGGAGNDTLLGGFGDDDLQGGDGDDTLVGGGQIEITVTNLQTADGALLTPFFLATTDGVYDFFDVGSAASASLESLAEDGATGGRITAALNSGGVNEALATPGGPLAPGDSRTVTFYATSTNNLTRYLSFASMVIPSNDAFIGNDSPLEIDLFDAAGNLIQRVGDGAFVITGDDVYDAGTEVNDEIPANTAALAQAAPNTGVTENGVIAQHPGFQGSARLGGPVGNILTARPNADFTDGNPNVASIQVGTMLDGNDRLDGGAGNDMLDGTEGDDTLIGGYGNDTILGGIGNDTLIGGFGDDDLQGGDGDDTLVGGGQIEITVTNLQTADGALLTPFFLATTDGVYDFFDVGSAASASLESLAEDGATGGRITAALNSGGVNEALATPGGPLAPGDSRTVTFYATSTNNLTRYLSFASMVIPSNDAFIGNDSPLEIDLFDAAGNLIQRVGDGAFVITGDDVYDAGTEVNDEIPANTAALAQAAPNTGVTENGVIAQHPGFQGSVRLGGPVGNILTARPNADFTDGNPNVASIQVGTMLDGNDTLDGGAGNDTLDGTEGDDTLIGGAGNDMIVGGIGNDTVVVEGPTADYTVDGLTQISDTVADRDGVDSLDSVGVAQFSDGSSVLVEATPDGGVTTTTPIAFTFTFGDDVTGFEASDVSVVNGSVASVTAVDARTYTVEVTPFNAGAVQVSIAADVASNADGFGNLAESVQVTSNVGVPVINSPGRFPGARPTITWNAVDGAGSYEVWIARVAPGTSRILIGESIVSTNEFTPSADLAPALYRVWVRGQGGDWSTPIDFEVQPTLIGPVTPTFEQRPTFAWEAIPGATGYQLFIRTRDASFGNSGDLVINNIPASETTFTVGQDLPAGAVRWWVRATNSFGNTGWSDVGLTDVTARAVVLEGNANTIVWSEVQGAGRYILHVEDLAGNVVIRENRVLDTSFSPDTALASGGYRAWVKAIDAVSDAFNSAPWSFRFDFTVASLEDGGQQDAQGVPELQLGLGEAQLAVAPVVLERDRPAAPASVDPAAAEQSDQSVVEATADSVAQPAEFASPLTEEDHDFIDVLLSDSLRLAWIAELGETSAS